MSEYDEFDFLPESEKIAVCPDCGSELRRVGVHIVCDTCCARRGI